MAADEADGAAVSSGDAEGMSGVAFAYRDGEWWACLGCGATLTEAPHACETLARLWAQAFPELKTREVSQSMRD